MREDELVRGEPTNIDRSELAPELGRGWGIRIFDDSSKRAAASSKLAFATHGESHPASLLRPDDGLFLVDLDTLGAEAAERDLWWLAGHPDALAQYERATGRILARPPCAAGFSEHLRQRCASHPKTPDSGSVKTDRDAAAASPAGPVRLARGPPAQQGGGRG